MMSDTSSTLADWAQLYHHPTSPFGCSSALTDSTVITTTAAASSIVSGPSPHPGTGGIEGRVGKSARRRSRASRRAPVTLLNTDTTNFRAMVQQFTGISSGSSSSSSSSYSSSRNFNLSNGPLINFGFNDQFNQGGMVMPIGQSSYQHQQQQQQQQQYQQYDESMFNNNNNSNLVEMNDGISFDGVSTRMMPKMSSTNNRVDGYFT